jgi:hypothetical protein
MASPSFISSKTAIFALGAASAVVWNTAVPIIGNVLRPLLKEVIKGGIILGRGIQTVAEEAWQDVEDLTAEAKAELDRDSGDKGGNGTGA